MGWRHEETKTLVWEAIDALKGGRPDDALVILERTVQPKWWSSTAAANDYARKKAGASAKAVSAYADAATEW